MKKGKVVVRGTRSLPSSAHVLIMTGTLGDGECQWAAGLEMRVTLSTMGMKLTTVLSMAAMSVSGGMCFMQESWWVVLQPTAAARLSQLVVEEEVSERGPKDVWPLDMMAARKGG